MNEKLEVNTLILKDYNAIAAQHEIDHVNGMVIMDRKYRDVNRRK
jgi:peptide deformylase